MSWPPLRRLGEHVRRHGSCRATVANPVHPGAFSFIGMDRGITGSVIRVQLDMSLLFVPDDAELRTFTVWASTLSFLHIPEIHHFND